MLNHRMRARESDLEKVVRPRIGSRYTCYPQQHASSLMAILVSSSDPIRNSIRVLRMSDTNSKPDPHSWEQGFEDHERQQLQRLAKLSFAEKLQWLEDAHKLVLQLQKSRPASSDNDSPPLNGHGQGH